MRSYLANDGTRLAVDRFGHGPPVILIHGFASSGRIFRYQIAALSAHFTVYTPDLRGHGRSADVAHGARVARLGRDLHDLIDTIGAPQVGLVGWSMGAAVAWSYLDVFGDGRVAAHAFIDELPFVMEAVDSLGTDRTQLDPAPFVGLHARFADPAVREKAVQQFISGMLHDVTPVDRLKIMTDARRAAQELCVRQLLDSNATDFRDLIAKLQKPTLFVGAQKSFFKVAFHDWMHAQVPRSQLAVCQDAGHFVLVEQPAWLNDQLVPFFRTHLDGANLPSHPPRAPMENQS